MPSLVCQWKPFRIPVGDSFEQALVEEWVCISDESSDGQKVMDFPVLTAQITVIDCIPVTPKISRQTDSHPWEPTKTEDKAYFLGT